MTPTGVERHDDELQEECDMTVAAGLQVLQLYWHRHVQLGEEEQLQVPKLGVAEKRGGVESMRVIGCRSFMNCSGHPRGTSCSTLLENNPVLLLPLSLLGAEQQRQTPCQMDMEWQQSVLRFSDSP